MLPYICTGDGTVTRYIGCYKENENGLGVLKGFQKNFPDSLTPQKCIDVCYSKGFRYAGMQYAYVCPEDLIQNVKLPVLTLFNNIKFYGLLNIPGSINITIFIRIMI